ncbi:MAG: Carboxyl-terminal protease [Candidatus Moranbacteria bacterium GW2011_GWA2_39_41]|nr:MAG: Carboxyl-terminal protease [Candidatus Moranbacteria bacterium GW2011_GWA2_39_41]
MDEERTPEISPEKKNKNIFSKYLSFFIILFLLIGAFWLGYTNGKKSADELILNQEHPIGSTIVTNQFSTGKDTVDFGLFWKVWDTLKVKYANQSSLDAQKLVYGAIKGMLKATDDPYTTFFDPKETKEFAQDIQGSFDGIGAELGIKDDILTVIAPLDGSPAQKAGLMSGDKIVKIGDKTTSDLTIDAAVDLIRGKKGTEVQLTVFHKGDQETRDITIIRDTIEVKSVKVEFKDNNIAYLKINQFGEKTSKEFDVAMNQIIAQGSKGIVLDLRNNPGGFLTSSIEIASRFIPRGKVVVSEEDSAGKKDNLYTSGGDKLNAIPLVVLINEGSASASEILAGALRDNRGVQLIGKKSFGKGSVQELIGLPGKSSVKITVAKWLTPNGDYIMEKGITPDTEVELTLEDFKAEKDPQMDKAVKIIRGLVN